MIEEVDIGQGHILGMDLMVIFFPAVAVIGAIVVGWQYFFGVTVKDFTNAKSEGKPIVCMGIVKSYRVEADDYKIVDGKVQFKYMLTTKKFSPADCHIKD